MTILVKDLDVSNFDIWTGVAVAQSELQFKAEDALINHQKFLIAKILSTSLQGLTMSRVPVSSLYDLCRKATTEKKLGEEEAHVNVQEFLSLLIDSKELGQDTGHFLKSVKVDWPEKEEGRDARII